jgi:hypothetical protein
MVYSIYGAGTGTVKNSYGSALFSCPTKLLTVCSAYMGPDAGEDVMQQHHVLLLQSSAITELTTLYTQVPYTE